MKKCFFSPFLFFPFFLLAQKKPLDHSVYDSWQSIGERMISNDGKWVVYTVCPQVGDTTLFIQSSDAKYKKEIEHSKNAVITEDSRYVIFKIRPLYKDLREAWIKKKKADEMPQDSLGIVELGKEMVWKTANIKSYKTPDNAAGWVAYQLEKEKNVSKENANSGGSDLILRQTTTGKEKIFKNINEYYFNKTGRKLLLLTSKTPKDSLSKIYVLLYDLRIGVIDTLSRSGNDFRNFTMTDDGSQIAYIAERDATPKALQKFYKLWYYKEGMDSAVMLVDKNSVGMMLGATVSEFSHPDFSKSGKRLFFGTAPIEPPKDTSLVDIDLVKVDIWNYKDDYLQTVQTNPTRLRNDLQKNYLAVYDLQANTILQLGSEKIPQVIQTDEGDGDTFVGVTDYGKRIESQWLGDTRKDIYAIDVKTGNRKLVKENLHGFIYPSSTGKYIMWYDRPAKNYFIWDGKTTRNISAKIKVPLWNEDFNNPDDPTPYGVMGWHEEDSAVYVYDKYDIWKVDPSGNIQPNAISNGRKYQLVRRYVSLDPEEKVIKSNAPLVIRVFNDKTKNVGLETYDLKSSKNGIPYVPSGPFSINNLAKAKNANDLILTEESYVASPDLYVASFFKKGDKFQDISGPFNADLSVQYKLSSLNPQQKDYNWGTAELFHWKTFKGKQADGIVYKPEDFNPKKKYPMICYFYEELDNTLNNYIPPAPIRSAINISFFVSRGYIIFVPSIKYDVGHPGKSAYDYVVSGAKALIAKGFVDSKNIAIQGHSWGGYQVAYLVTATNMFKAAWAGAPVANMTSAYGGIRWESGVSRQFQYEKGQSRIGGTLWDKFNLYIENSPLFHLKNVTTPLVIWQMIMMALFPGTRALNYLLL
ncbi:MAG TPA: prolyl oligopeptidase family serine peptidase [Chitinophagaceae bacterium]|nr:prolyl oligopeptidase family serine peptidase [Chitinophagaceae bacterium]